MPKTALPGRAVGLCRTSPAVAEAWIASPALAAWIEPTLLICAGGGLYGLSMGAWRDPLLAVFVGVKLPLLLIATAVADALLNALWARRLGLELTVGQALRAVLSAFALASLVLASLAPVVLLFDLALPGPHEPGARLAHDVLGLAHVGAIATAGVVAVLRQQRWLRGYSRAGSRAGRVVLLWLCVNLFVGAQLSWNLRPWFGTPGITVQFLRDDPFRGTFYESVFRMIRR